MTNLSNLILILVGLPAFLIIYRLVPVKWQKSVLIAGSLIYYIVYSDFSILAISFMLISAILNYLLLFPLNRINKPLIKKVYIWAIVLFNVGILCASKITGVTVTGLSFYIFTLIALQIDLYRQYEEIGFVDFLTYIYAFPKLAMGPITRYSEQKDKIKLLDKEYGLISKSLRSGIKLFILGLGMKTIIADQLSTMWNSICVSGVLGITTETAWLGALAYSLELYLDFWGYSLMAVGLGKMVGLQIPRNFDAPYTSKTVSEFWRRWHVTLGAWFRDYIYIPLGGSREGKLKTVVNLMIVWAITGLWHGGSINFLLWGGVLGLIVVLEKLTPLGKLSNTKVIGHIYVIVILPITWMIFAHSNLNDMWIYLKVMFGMYSQGASPANGQFVRYMRDYWYLLLMAIFVVSPPAASLYEKIKKHKWGAIVYVLIFWASIYLMYSSTSNPFMYAAF